MFPGAHLDHHADRPALIMGGSGFTQTFAELDAAANRLSRVLRNAGLQPGDHVAICMENHDRYMEVVWGCHYAGLIYTCASRLTPSKEFLYRPEAPAPNAQESEKNDASHSCLVTFKRWRETGNCEKVKMRESLAKIKKSYQGKRVKKIITKEKPE